MGFPENVLAPNEKVLVSLRPHWRVVAAPTVIGVILVAVSGYVAWRTPDDSTGNWIQWVVVGVALLLGIWLVVVPFVVRACTQYVITSHRVMVRRGVVTKNGKDIALSKITDVSFTKTPSDRILGSGTLRVESAGDSPDETFHSIPHSDRIQQLLNHAIETDANKHAERMLRRSSVEPVDPSDPSDPPASPDSPDSPDQADLSELPQQPESAR
ncbi:MAG: PH domain-containing protein [Actinomycetota bacterium]|nr:PH domain-containing protein [Actinomycetota bacterium]